MKSLLIFGMLILSTQVFALSDKGNGGDTYKTQMLEARELAISALTELVELKTVNKELQDAYRSNRLKWIEALKKAQFVPVPGDLYDNEEEKGARAAVAFVKNNSIYLSQSYWGKYPVSLIQSVILVIHEAGHLASVPLSHDKLDQVGDAINREKLGDFFGQKGLEVLKEKNQKLSPSDILKLFYERAPEPATINDLKIGSLLFDPKFKCILTSSKRDFGNGKEIVNFWFDVEEDSDSELGPVFNLSDKLEVVTVPRKTSDDGYSMNYPTRFTYSSERSTRDLIVKGNYNLSLDSREAYEDTILSFRKSGDLVVFSLDTQPSYGANYGYCWPIKK